MMHVDSMQGQETRGQRPLRVGDARPF
jgi:hypothetical protein